LACDDRRRASCGSRRPCGPPLRCRPARAFRDHEQREEIDRGGDRLQPEHPAPGGIAEPEIRGRAAGIAGEREVRDERAGQAGDDHDLLHARQAAADRGWRDFGNVDRRDDTSRTDAKAADDPCENEDFRARRSTGEQRAEQEKRSGEHHDVAATDRVGHPPGAERTDSRADQDRPDIDPDSEPTETERRLQALLRAVDHTRIIAEHEAADRRHRDDRGDEAMIDRGAPL
jgi:hypothetical protein